MADASYIMGDGETPDFAEARALQKAKQAALEEAGTYVQSYTRVQNLDLTAEEIQTIAGGVLQVEVLEKTRRLVADGLRFNIKIRATVTTEKMEELARRIKGKNVAEEYTKLQTEYAKLSRELDAWKQRAAKTTQGPERNFALERIREGEKAFAQTQQSEAAFFERLVSGQDLMHTARVAKYKVDSLLDNIMNNAYVIKAGEASAHTEKSSEKWFPWGNWPLTDQVATITVPITIRVSEKLLTTLYETFNSLGGSTNFSSTLGLTYLVPASVAEYVVDKRWGPFSRRLNDTGYRGGDFAKVESASAGFSLIPSENQNLNRYFYQRLSATLAASRVPVIEFILQGGKNYSCTVPSIVNRIFSTRASYGKKYSVYLSQNSDAPVSDSAILLTEPIKFYVEVQLSSERAEQVDRVMGRFEEYGDSPSDTCRVILEEF
ncbi:MAG: hypothetical protein HOP22_03365 [Nitrospiraceae bacterium]|nr:hypothetical protein [Nitrospiraceae bacterium]